MLFDADGAPYGSFGICQDVTDTKIREQELNDLLRRNATLYEALEASPIGVAVLTPEDGFPPLEKISVGLFYKHMRMTDAGLALIKCLISSLDDAASPKNKA